MNYRTPAEIMEVAARVLAVTDPEAEPPRSVRRSGAVPRFARCRREEVIDEVMAHVARVRSELAEGKTAVIAPEALVGDIRGRLGELPSHADVLDAAVGVFGATDAKGLEFDAVVLVEPAAIAGSTVAGLRGLYVALTRATRFLTVLHSDELPPGLRVEP